MKKRIAIVNFAIMVAVLFSMLFQSFHAIGHLEHEFSKKKCHHAYGETHQEITHQHHDFDHCLVCDFSLSHYIPVETIRFPNFVSHKPIPYFFTEIAIYRAFSGNAASLRGPPSFIA